MPAAERGATRVGVEQCAEGHALQTSTAEAAGRCEGCSRWVFGKEKVMSCGCCSSYYCSACAPQVRSQTDDEHYWEDILSTLGSALRDCERMKDRITSEIDFDLERIRSAFNCQNPESATLSAEQIVVEHAVGQVKSALSCSNPDISNLRSHEEVITRDSEVVFNNDRSPVARVDLATEVQESTTTHKQAPIITDKAPVDLLDLSSKQESVAPVEPAFTHVDLLDLSSTEYESMANDKKAPVDLLDISLQPEVQAQVGLLDLAEPQAMAAEIKAPVDLLDFGEPTVAPGAQEPVAQAAKEELPDLI